MRCQHCGREGPAQSKFCVFCGAAASDAHPTAPEHAPTRPSDTSEPAPTTVHRIPEYLRSRPPTEEPPPTAVHQVPEYLLANPPPMEPTPTVAEAAPTGESLPVPQREPPVPWVRPQWQAPPPPPKKRPILAIVIVAVVVLVAIGLAWQFIVAPRLSGSATSTAAASGQVASATPAPATATTVPTAVPSPTPAPAAARPPVSLENGTNISPPAAGPAGLGKLTIKNGTNRDAVAKLVTGTTDPATWQTQRFVYVKANNTLVLENVPVGTYRLAFMSGVDWDAGARKFLREVSTSVFDEPFEFKEEPTQGGTRFTTWDVSLNPVAGGTGKTTALQDGAFGPE
jgi:hypothetical protein